MLGVPSDSLCQIIIIKYFSFTYLHPLWSLDTVGLSDLTNEGVKPRFQSPTCLSLRCEKKAQAKEHAGTATIRSSTIFCENESTAHVHGCLAAEHLSILHFTAVFPGSPNITKGKRSAAVERVCSACIPDAVKSNSSETARLCARMRACPCVRVKQS